MPTQFHYQINGDAHQLAADPDRSLLSLLRDEIGLTGPKYGCGDGKCGACTVHINGEPVQSCSITAGAAAQSQITTVEGLAQNGRLHALQSAFLEMGALQCGYCTPGMLMSAAALLATNPSPSTEQIVHAMQDNICRCGAYQRIIAAIHSAAAKMQAKDGTDEDSAALIPDIAPHEAAGPGVVDTDEPIPTKTDEGIFVAYPCPELAVALYGEDAIPPAPEERALSEIGPWLHIDGEGGITVAVGKAEVGQNIRTSLAQIVAEELRVPSDRVRVVLGDTALTPYDRGTFGSRTTPVTGPQLWRVGATTRELLLELAAANWRVDPSELALADGSVSHPESGRSATLGELARDRNLLRIADVSQPITPPANWQVAGRSPAKVNGAAFVTGRHRFASDMALAGVLHGKILRPPAYQASLQEIDTETAQALPGVTVVQDGDFVGVVAPDSWQAEQALGAIRTRWKRTLQVSQPELFDYLKASPAPEDGRHRPYLGVEGDAEAALSSAHLTLTRQFTVDYIAHTPLEPRAALAQWHGDRLTVWTGTSRPFGVRTELALAFAIPEANVRVIVPDTGSGYGGKHTGQAAIEAARLARAVDQPVKLVWTREEEFTWAYLRPAGLIEISGGVDAEGRFVGLDLRNYNSGAAGIESMYDIPNRHIVYQPCDAPLPQGSYRSLAAPANHFARETLADELAHELGIDPLAFRLRNLTHPRMRAVLTAAADAFGWGKQTPPPQHGYGIAGGADKDSYIATCAEVFVDPESGEVKVVRLVAAYDCGAMINPDNVRNQVEGALVQGLGGALFESIGFTNGRIDNPNFADYRVPRFGDAPQIETVLLDRRDIPPAGAGETPILAVAPAIGNAIFQATGVRLRSLPLAPNGVQR
jgi:nicotinate dehydrogenase subunit B